MSILGSVLSTLGVSSLSSALGKLRSNLYIVLSVNNGASKLIFPIVPKELPEIESPQANDTFSAVTGDLNVIGAMGLRTLTIESFFPVWKTYPFIRPFATHFDGWQSVEWIEKYRKAGIPFRLQIVETTGIVRLNMACTIDTFTYKQNAANDIDYSLSFREYKFVDTTPRSDQSSEGVIA